MARQTKTLRVAFMASHNGTAFRVMLEGRTTSSLEIDPVLLVSNNQDCEALNVAAKHFIPTHVFSPKAMGDEAADRALSECLNRYTPDVIVLAGYMRKIGPITLGLYHDRIINSHPALLPKFGGQGMYGRHVHDAVIAAKETQSGITIHYVDKNYDTGAIIYQKSFGLAADETAETLESKVKSMEADAYIEALKIIDARR